MSSFNVAAKIRLLAVPTLLLLSAQVAAAGEPITVSSTVPYANDRVGSPVIRAQCSWNTDLVAFMVRESKGSVVATDKDLSELPGRKLILTITNVHAAGGGAFSGPKWAILRGELMENGKLQGNFQIRRVSRSSRFTACGFLDKIGRALAIDTLEWLKHPTVSTVVNDEAESKSTE